MSFMTLSIKYFEYCSWRIIFLQKEILFIYFHFRKKKINLKKYWLSNNIGIKNKKPYGTKNSLGGKKNKSEIYGYSRTAHRSSFLKRYLKMFQKERLFFLFLSGYFLFHISDLLRMTCRNLHHSAFCKNVDSTCLQWWILLPWLLHIKALWYSSSYLSSLIHYVTFDTL